MPQILNSFQKEILKEKKIHFPLVFKWLKKKFTVEIDPVLFASNALKGADKLSIIKPIILKKRFFNPKAIKSYLQKQAEQYLKKKIK